MSAPPPPREPGPFDDLFEPFVPPPRPKRVSPEAWEEVFPFERRRVLAIAGRLFLRGEKPDAAVRRAVVELDRERAAAFGDRLLQRVSALFPDPDLDGPPRLSPAEAAALAVVRTAHRAWDSILGAPAPIRAAFYHRVWEVPPGRCLVCGGEAGSGDSRFRAASHPAGGGDAIHAACKPRMARIGPAWGDFTLQEARRRRDAVPRVPDPDAIPEGVDPDDSSTWGVPG